VEDVYQMEVVCIVRDVGVKLVHLRALIKNVRWSVMDRYKERK